MSQFCEMKCGVVVVSVWCGRSLDEGWHLWATIQLAFVILIVIFSQRSENNSLITQLNYSLFSETPTIFTDHVSGPGRVIGPLCVCVRVRVIISTFDLVFGSS